MDAGKAFLRQTNKDGVSVYSHLTTVLSTLLEKKPANALDMLEGVSLACKASAYQPDAVTVPETPPEVLDAPAEEWHTATAALMTAAKPPEEGAEASGTVSDVVYERSMFQCAGVGLSSDETYRVYVSLVQLQKSKDLSSVRFFGKVLGVPGDYYIAEGQYNTPPEPEDGAEPPPPPPGAPVEENGVKKGCNQWVYFACSDPSGAWTALPDVTPQQIVCSKRIRKFLTGNLEADVRAYPPFPGQEKAYLRALIARISAATTVCPAGAFTLEEDAEEPTPVEIGEDEGQRKAIAATNLAEPSGWVTKYMGILEIGRCTNPPVEEEEAEEGDDKPKAPEPQPEIPFLSPISSEEWTTATYVHGGPITAIARSVRWPGAYAAYQLVKGVEMTASFYVGYGHETLAAPFKMEAPPPFEVEPDEVAEQEDMPLAEENAAYIKVLEAQVAEEAANLPDEPAPEE